MAQIENLQAQVIELSGKLERASSQSTVDRYWDLFIKIAVPFSTAALLWSVQTLVSHSSMLNEISKTYQTREDSLRLRADMIARENPQLTLLITEMRAMSLKITERLTRLETEVQQLKER